MPYSSCTAGFSQDFRAASSMRFDSSLVGIFTKSPLSIMVCVFSRYFVPNSKLSRHESDAGDSSEHDRYELFDDDDQNAFGNYDPSHSGYCTVPRKQMATRRRIAAPLSMLMIVDSQ